MDQTVTNNASTIEILERLIGFPSVSRNSNLDIIDWIQTFLNTRGFYCHRIPDPTGTKAGLFASLGHGAGGVMLSAHTDVVPVEGQDWTSDPFTLSKRGSRYYGRGTCDMKGFLACALTLADQASQLALTEPLKLAISYDEEIGCVGIAHMIDHLPASIGLPRVCIVGEPTNLGLVTAHKGKMVLRANCSGMAGHSSLAPRFMNALHLASDLVQEIRAQQHVLHKAGARDDAYAMPCSTLHVGRMSGGTALNIVPESATLDFELRHLPQDAPGPIIDAVMRGAERITENARKDHPTAKIEITEQSAYPALQTPESAGIVEWIKGFLPAQTPTGKVDFGTEAGHFAKVGVPVVVCGPSSIAQAHKPDEFIDAAQLHQCDILLSRILASITAT